MQPMPELRSDQPEIEYLDGRPYPKVSPRLEHGLVQLKIGRILADCAADRGFVVPEVRFRSGPITARKTEFVPDIAFISGDRLKDLSGETLQKPPFSPDIAIEIRSPSEKLRYLRSKIERYLSTGSVLVLDVDPKTRNIRAHTRESVQVFHADDDFSHDAVPWLKFAVNDVFADLDRI